jgi:Rap1a immunity proteins
MKKFKWFGFLLVICAEIHAAPTAGTLLVACEDALKNGFHGSTGMMCSWYVTPCDCHQGKDIAIPRVCLSGDEAEGLLATIVVEGLKSQPDLQSQSAEMAAGIILSAMYPCD